MQGEEGVEDSAHDPSCGEGSDEEGRDEAEAPKLEERQREEACKHSATLYNAEDVNDRVFEELVLPPEVLQEVQHVWAAFLASTETMESAADALYCAIFDASLALQSLFKTPRAIASMKVLAGINSIVNTLQDPKGLHIATETLGYQHFEIDITPPRIALFRDAIVDLLSAELGSRFTSSAMMGFRILLNYVGGAFVYLRNHFSRRLQILASSWSIANKRNLRMAEVWDADGSSCADSVEISGKKPGSTKSTNSCGNTTQETHVGAQAHSHRGRGRQGHRTLEDSKSSGEPAQSGRNFAIPTKFQDMFMFNAAVMGFGDRLWMGDALAAFDSIVCNVANSHRVQEECDVLSLRLARCRGRIYLEEFKAVLLASLRSLVPKAWDSEHEVAWLWLWGSVEEMLRSQLGKPARFERALSQMWRDLGGDDHDFLRHHIYVKFFELAPIGMDYFRQSTTRLRFIADKVLALTLELYQRPAKVVLDLSALGLRHVGYAIPTELFAPFVSACVHAVGRLTSEAQPLEAFRWSLSLISRILTRVINEGSTLVMRAINANSGKQLSKAVSCAPRGERAAWMLSNTVGTESISPLLWAIETGSFDAAEAIIRDLLTIRADRERYYYGADALFERHPDIVRRLCMDAPALLPAFLDGLMWRSRSTENGRRRVNYFAKHLIVDSDGCFAPAIEWLSDHKDPKLVCHPLVSYTIDLVWTRAAARAFLHRKSWLMLMMTVYTISQAILNSGLHDPASPSLAKRTAVFLFRCFIYCISLPSLVGVQVKQCMQDIRKNDFVRLQIGRVPSCLVEANAIVCMSLCVCLIVALTCEPILHCFGAVGPDGNKLLFVDRCEVGDQLLELYGTFSMCGLLCYYALILDLCVFSNTVSAFMLVFGRVLSELWLCVTFLAFMLLAFATSTVALKPQDSDFDTIPASCLMLLRMFLGMASCEFFEHLHTFPVLFSAVVVFVFLTTVCMVNVLIAQLACAYRQIFGDMVGLARLKRGSVCVLSMSSVSQARWECFVRSLRLDTPCEFGEGDVGLPGAIQVTEPASANVTTVEAIRRFGGSTSPAALWPEVDGATGGTAEKLDRMEHAIRKAMKVLGGGRARAGSGQGSSGFGSGAVGSSGSRSSDQSAREED